MRRMTTLSSRPSAPLRDLTGNENSSSVSCPSFCALLNAWLLDKRRLFSGAVFPKKPTWILNSVYGCTSINYGCTFQNKLAVNLFAFRIKSASQLALLSLPPFLMLSKGLLLRTKYNKKAVAANVIQQQYIRLTTVSLWINRKAVIMLTALP